MALGRSNSLSINTGATNSLFGQQQQQQQHSQQPNTSSLFGSNTQNTQVQLSGGLFGNTAPQPQAQPNGSLFGNTPNTQAQPSGGLFGNTTQQSQPQQNSSRFNAPNTQNPNAAGGTGGLFGGGNTTQVTQSTGGLFGGGSNTQPNQGTTGLFGSGANTQQHQGANTLFGVNTSTPHSQQPGGGGLFGGTGSIGNMGANAPSLFSRQTQPAITSTTSSFLGGSTLGGSAFGANTQQAPRQQTPSLLSATQHNQMNQAAPFGRLSMGQGAVAPTNVGAAKVDYAELRPTTRFEDCIDSVKHELETVDKMIQQQEAFAKQIEAFLPRHEENVNSLAPDVDFIKSKVEDVEHALAAGAHSVEARRKNAERDYRDVERVQRVVTNLALPSAWRYSSRSVGAFGSMYHSQPRPQQAVQASEADDPTNHDLDLIGNYFVPMAAELQEMTDRYATNLVEIEDHMRVIESLAVAQAQHLAKRKTGTNGNAQPSSEDTVRELAATLRGFEESILGVAGVVGECREGVNQLILGRMSGIP